MIWDAMTSVWKAHRQMQHLIAAADTLNGEELKTGVQTLRKAFQPYLAFLYLGLLVLLFIVITGVAAFPGYRIPIMGMSLCIVFLLMSPACFIASGLTTLRHKHPELVSNLARTARMVGAVSCFIIGTTAFFYYHSSTQPHQAALATLAAISLGLGIVLGWVRLPTWIARRIVFLPLTILVMAYLSSLFPGVALVASTVRPAIDRAVVDTLPEPNELTHLAADELEGRFRHPHLEIYLVWYAITDDGEYRLFDGKTYRWNALELADTQDEIDHILNWARERDKRLANEQAHIAEQRRQQQARAEAASRPPPEEIVIRREADLQFVHPVTGEFILWYFLADSGDYVFYKSSGFHRLGAELQLADSDSEFVDIREWVVDQESIDRAEADTARQLADESERRQKQAEIELQAQINRDAQATEAAKQTAREQEEQRQRQLRVSYMDSLVQKSGGKIVEFSPIKNGSGMNLDVASLGKYFEGRLTRALGLATYDSTRASRAELLERSDVVLFALECDVQSVEITQPPPEFGDGTRLLRVIATVQMRAVDLRTGQEAWVEEITDGETHIAESVKSVPDLRLASNAIKLVFDRFEKDKFLTDFGAKSDAP